jgi:PAS domain S-box-containing protein
VRPQQPDTDAEVSLGPVGRPPEGPSGGAPGNAWPATLIVDQDGQISHWSYGAERLFGRPSEKAIGQPMLGTCVPREQAETVASLLRITATGTSWSGQLHMLVDGRSVEVECAWQPLLDGATGAALVIVTDTRNRMLPIGSASAVVDAVRHFHDQASSAAARGRVALLNEASVRIGTTLDMYHTARELIEVAIPRLADAGTVMVFESLVTEFEKPISSAQTDDDGSISLQRLALGSVTDYPRWSAAFPVGEVVTYPSDSPYAEVLRAAQSKVLMPTNLKEAEQVAGMWNRVRVTPLLARHSLLIVPLVARSAVLGVIMFNRAPGRRPFAESDMVLGEELAARAAMCIDNARLYSRERRTALMLQQSLLPEKLVPHASVEVAYRYLPGSNFAEVGGDWFDLIPLSGSRVAFVVGDVMGNGLRAAAIMGQLRTAVRTLASLDLPPAEVLRQLDESVQHLGGSQFATCLYAAYDPVSRTCEIARAGHVPPILVDPEGNAEILDLPPGLPLGVGGMPFESVELSIADGCTLALCTDGLVESRERDLEVGLEIMREHLSGPGKPLEDIAEDLVAVLFHEVNRDDTALLLARLSGLPPDAVMAWTLPSVPRSAGDARRLVRGQLAEWGLQRITDNVELLTSELVTNAVRYGGGPVRLRVVRDENLLCEVSDSAEPPPRLHVAGPDDVDGRGLLLVNQIANRWGTRRLPTGKTVWFELEVH